MSSERLRKKGHCCKSGCLHCPYGYTLKKFGLSFVPASDETIFALSVMNDAQKRDFESNGESFHVFRLKDVNAGVIKVDHIKALEIMHEPSFSDQGLDLAVVESYFFY